MASYEPIDGNFSLPVIENGICCLVIGIATDQVPLDGMAGVGSGSCAISDAKYLLVAGNKDLVYRNEAIVVVLFQVNILI